MWVLVDYFQENKNSLKWPEMLDTPMTLWSMEEYKKAFLETGFSNVKQYLFDEKGKTVDPLDATLCTCGRKPPGTEII